MVQHRFFRHRNLMQMPGVVVLAKELWTSLQLPEATITCRRVQAVMSAGPMSPPSLIFVVLPSKQARGNTAM